MHKKSWSLNIFNGAHIVGRNKKRLNADVASVQCMGSLNLNRCQVLNYRVIKWQGLTMTEQNKQNKKNPKELSNVNSESLS